MNTPAHHADHYDEPKLIYKLTRILEGTLNEYSHLPSFEEIIHIAIGAKEPLSQQEKDFGRDIESLLGLLESPVELAKLSVLDLKKQHIDPLFTQERLKYDSIRICQLVIEHEYTVNPIKKAYRQSTNKAEIITQQFGEKLTALSEKNR